MASLMKRNEVYYARIRWTENYNRKEKLFSLGTRYQKEAVKRRLEIEQNISLIMDENFTPSWKSKNGLPGESNYRLSEGIADFLKYRKSRIRGGTLILNERGLNRFIKAVKDRGVRSIDNKVIDKHINYYSSNIHKLSRTTINMDLRVVKVFMKWLYKRNKIVTIPDIEQLNISKKKPIYLTNTQFETICNRVEPHYKRAFHFYRETGLRLFEPFDGELNGEFLTIPAEKSKSRNEHEIYVPPELMDILKEMRMVVNARVSKKTAIRENAIKYYSRVFGFACKGDKEQGLEPIKNRHFHCIRHTTAVRLYLKTRDIYAVMKQLGHQSVTTTERYSQFKMKRLVQDFPDLVKATPKTGQKQAENPKGVQNKGDYPYQAYA